MNKLSCLLFLLLALFFTDTLKAENSSPNVRDNTFFLPIGRPEGTAFYKKIDMTYTEVFRRLGMKLKVIYEPLKRTTKHASRGQSDGVAARIYGYAKNRPNLIRVDEPVFDMTVMAYTSDSSLPHFKGWESLKGTEYRVEYARGMIISRNNLSKVVKSELLTSANNANQGLRRLAAKRIDVYVDNQDATIPVFQNLDVHDRVFEAGVMEQVPLYMFVHERHQAIVPKLEQAIKAMKEEELIKKYHAIAFGVSEK